MEARAALEAQRPLDKYTYSLEQFLQDRGLAESTIEFKLKIIRHLSRRFNLWDTDSITHYARARGSVSGAAEGIRTLAVSVK